MNDLVEFAFEDGLRVDMTKLETGQIIKESFKQAHGDLVICTHDAVVRYNYQGENGIILAKRRIFPLKGELWFPGGRMLRGLPLKDSLNQKVFEEFGLNIGPIEFWGDINAYMRTDPFGHGHGTHTYGPVFYTVGEGELKINELHERPIIVTPEKYTSEFRASLHQGIVPFLDRAMIKIRND